MVMMYVLFLLSVIFIRGFAGYDSRKKKEKYIVIKSRILSTLLLDEMVMFENTYRLKKDRNKMSIVGLIYYLAALVVLIISIVFALIPNIPCEPWTFESAKFVLFADSLNDKIVTVAITLLLSAVWDYIAVSIIKFTKDTKPTWLRIFIWVTACFMILISCFPCIYMMINLILSFFVSA